MSVASAEERPLHRRNKSASVLKSIIPSSKAIKRNHAKEGQPGQSHSKQHYNPFTTTQTPILPPNHPHSGQRALNEIPHTNNTPSPRRSKDTISDRPNPPQKKALSSISLHTLGRDRDKDDMKDEKARIRSRSSRRAPENKAPLGIPKRSKSSTSLVSVFSKHKSAKMVNRDAKVEKDQENTTPPSSAITGSSAPIWAQFASTAVDDARGTTIQERPNSGKAAVDKRALAAEINRYTPKETEQRNFFGYDQSILGRAELPKSGNTAGHGVPNYSIIPLSRKGSTHQAHIDTTSFNPPETKSSKQSSAPVISKPDSKFSPKRGFRVMAAVSMWNGKAKDVNSDANLDAKLIDAEFEAVLESRNIAENMRPQMRSLKTSLKADFIRHNKIEARTESSGSDGSASSKNDIKAHQSGRGLSKEAAEEVECNVRTDAADPPSPTKRIRPLSKTFAFSRSGGNKGESSPTKKQKSEVSTEFKRSSRIAMLPNVSTTSLATSTSSSYLGRLQKSAVPEEYVSYLKMGTDVKEVEVGKLHKLRLLLRNETVSWVVSFIELGGMDEVVKLLHRIMNVEWREDHEDQLLHETLLCLKGLCTTDLALSKLSEAEADLFPALLAMIFDPEHKGPSEFTTRGIIMTILLAHLAAATSDPDILPIRAQIVLSYLADPSPSEEKTPIPFILSMRQSRPYKVWNTEINNVTKEVFWIFLHHLNIVPFPDTANSDEHSEPRPTCSPQPIPSPRTMTASEYTKEFFPRQRPPVPAAPYVGGVEWDATNYIASHLDLLNGIIASMTTRDDRNTLRASLRASGFEKIMGGMLRTCKDKFYDSVHDGLRTWVAAACADGWDVRDVRQGPRIDLSSASSSPRKGVARKKDGPPVLDVPPVLRLDIDVSAGTSGREGERVGEGRSGHVREGAFDDWV